MWLTVLRSLREPGLKFPRLTVADGHLGVRTVLGEIHPTRGEQRCWGQKLANMLNALPRKAQLTAAELLKAKPYEKTQAECERKRDAFVCLYCKTDPKAVDTLLRNRDRGVTFYAFPKEHWEPWRRLNAPELLPLVASGVLFKDGIMRP